MPVYLWILQQVPIDKDSYFAYGPVWALVFIILSALGIFGWRVWVDAVIPLVASQVLKDSKVTESFASLATSNKDMTRAIEEQTALLKQIASNTRECPAMIDMTRKSHLHTSQYVRPEGGQTT